MPCLSLDVHHAALTCRLLSQSNEYIRQLCMTQIQAHGGIQPGLESCWIGANDKGTEGTEVWSDGTELDYTNWWPGE